MFHDGEYELALGVEIGLGLWFFGFGEGFGGLVFALFEDKCGPAESSKSV